jgi:hypothetical protein
MASIGNVFDEIPGIPKPLLTRLPHSLQVMIVKLADNHAATVGVCKSMKVVSDEAQVMRRKELVSGIKGWEKNWDAFEFITKKEWGAKGYVPTCDCVEPRKCWHCNLGRDVWEMRDRHFHGEEYVLARMASRVFGDKCLWGGETSELLKPFRILDSHQLLVFRKRVVMIRSTFPDHVCVNIRDHLHDGIKPVSINQRLLEVRKNCPDLLIGGDAGTAAAKIVSVFDESDFAIEVYNPHSTCVKHFLPLDQFRCYDEDTFMEEVKKSCEKHEVSFVPRADVEDPIVMRAWDNGPIAFYWNSVLFTSDVIEGWIPDFALELL